MLKEKNHLGSSFACLSSEVQLHPVSSIVAMMFILWFDKTKALRTQASKGPQNRRLKHTCKAFSLSLLPTDEDYLVLTMSKSKSDDEQDVEVFAASSRLSKIDNGNGIKHRKTLKVEKGGGPERTLSLAFKDISAKTTRGAKKQILDKVSGFVASGDFLMVLGSSGGGKSKLSIIIKIRC